MLVRGGPTNCECCHCNSFQKSYRFGVDLHMMRIFSAAKFEEVLRIRYGLDARTCADQGLIHRRKGQESLVVLATTGTYMICFVDLSICCML
jgi:hypothetical protein